MSAFDNVRERLDREFVFITGQSDEFTEQQVALYRAVEACMSLDDVESAAVVLYVLETIRHREIENLKAGGGSGDELPEIRERMRLFSEQGIGAVPDPWNLR